MAGDEQAPGRRGRRNDTVRRHREKLAALQADRANQQHLLDLLRRRRQSRPGYPAFEVVPVRRRRRGEQEPPQVLQVRTELLAHTGTLDEDARRLIAHEGFTGTEIVELDRRVTVLTKAGVSAEEVERLRSRLERRGARASVAYLAPNRIVMKSTATPEQPVDLQPPTLDSSVPTDDGVRVVVLDTGVLSRNRTDHWLSGLENDDNAEVTDAFPGPDGNQKLDYAAGHGTFIAGIVRQADPALDLRVEKVSDSDGFAHEVDVAVAMVRAVTQALQDRVKLVLNLSLGTETVDGQPPVSLEVAMSVVRDLVAGHGGQVLVVAAAGNEGEAEPCWPAAFAKGDPTVVAVAALGLDQQPAPWSTHGDWVTCSVVGEAVHSTFVAGEEDPEIDDEPETFGQDAWAYWTGTSFAAPKVAAAVATHARRTGCSLQEALQSVLSGASGQHPQYGRLLTSL